MKNTVTLNLTNEQFGMVQNALNYMGDRLSVTAGVEQGLTFWNLKEELKEQKFTPPLYKKQITFDLDTKVKIPQFYNTVSNAFYHLEKQMMLAGFEHTQGSVYTSKEPMDDWECFNRVARICKELPWLYECATSMHITNVGNTYDMNKWLSMLCDKDRAQEMKDKITESKSMEENDDYDEPDR